MTTIHPKMTTTTRSGSGYGVWVRTVVRAGGLTPIAFNSSHTRTNSFCCYGLVYLLDSW
jgi:hypothetical protein